MQTIAIGVVVLASMAFAPACRMGESGRVAAFDSNTAPPQEKVPRTGSEVEASAGTDDVGTAPVTAQRRMHVDKAELGEPAPEFVLSDVNGKSYRLSQYKGKIIVLEWFNPRCPYCQEAYREGGVLREMPEHWMSDGVVWLAINSQGPSEPGSTVDENRAFMKEHALRTPVLMDPTGVVGKAYGAKTTPLLCVISDKGVLAYRGALDNAPHGVVPPKEVKTNYVDLALRDLRSGRAVVIREARTYGCQVDYAK